MRTLRTVQVCAFAISVFLLLTGDTLLAQGCSMCKTSLQGQADSIVNALKVGILVMLLPAVTIVAAIVLALRRSDEPEEPPMGPSVGPRR